jgi:hypothetical protein
MYSRDMSGWDWLLGTFMMGFWIVLIGVVVYFAVRLAHRDDEPRSHA